MNLNDIIQSAQGGAGLQNLANQFGLSPDQTQAAVQAIIPALSKGLQNAAQGGGLGGIISEMASGAHDGSYADPSQTGAAANAGSGALGQIFGNSDVAAQISDQISRVTGIDPATINGMLPSVASMALGGISHALQSQGYGNVLGQAGAAAPGADDQASSGGGGLLGSLMSVVQGVLGGGGSGGGAQPGLSTLINMFAPGVNVSADHAQALDNILQK
jgi:hypothetical protein